MLQPGLVDLVGHPQFQLLQEKVSGQGFNTQHGERITSISCGEIFPDSLKILCAFLKKKRKSINFDRTCGLPIKYLVCFQMKNISLVSSGSVHTVTATT